MVCYARLALSHALYCWAGGSEQLSEHEADTRSCALIAAWVVALASASAQGVRTEHRAVSLSSTARRGTLRSILREVSTAGITPAQIQQIIDRVQGRRPPNAPPGSPSSLALPTWRWRRSFVFSASEVAG